MLIRTTLILALACAPALGAKPFAQDGGSQTMTRARALAGLRGCAKRPRDGGCSDLSADFLINEYKRGRGDSEVLKVLLDAEPYGDGALSEGLGTFYAEMLQTRARAFLLALAPRPARARRDICESAGRTDGSGMSDAMLRGARANIRRIGRGRDPRLARVARECWAAASASDGETKSHYR